MCKKCLMIGAAILALVAAASPAAAQQAAAQGKSMEMSAPKGRAATITGTVVDVSCKFGQGLTGADHKMCAEICSDRGIPLAILGNDHKLYLPTSAAMPGDAQNARLKPYAEQKVRVRGTVFDAGGANAIQIASIDKAS